MPLNSKTKGKVGEREWAKWLRDVLGVAARRGVQYSGGPDSPDVISIPGIHFEVKRTEKFEIWKAIEQADKDAGPNKIAVVATRRNRSEWLIVLKAGDLPDLVALIWEYTDTQKTLPVTEGT